MKGQLVKLLLQILNSSWLNGTPCQYEYVGNVEAFTLGHLESTLRQEPGITLQNFLDGVYAFRSCSYGNGGLMVIEDGVPREGDIWDVHHLRKELSSGLSDGPYQEKPSVSQS